MAFRLRFIRLILGLSILISLVLGSTVAAKETLTVYVPGNALGIYGAYGEMAKQAAAELGYEVSIVTAATWAEYFQKILVHQASGMPVDLILADDITAAMYMASGMFLDLNPNVKRDRVNLSQFFPMSIDIKKYKSQLFALPVNVGVSVFYYNVDMLQGLGLADLPHDWKTSRWDWTEFVSTIRKATSDSNGDGLMDKVGLARWMHTIDPWIWGSDYVNADASRSNLNDPLVTEALQETMKLYTEYSAVQGAMSKVDKSIAHSTGSFYKAQALLMQGMDADAGGFAGQVKTNGNGSKINVTVFPKMNARHTTFNSWGWAIGNGSTNAEVAWKVIKTLTLDSSFITRNAANANRLPALRSAVPYMVNYLREKAPVDWQLIADALSDPTIAQVYRWYFNKNANEANTIINTMISSITSGKKSPSQALSENHEALDNVLRAGAW